MDKIIGVWHFVANDGRLGYGDGRAVAVGETLSVPPPSVLCKHGMHWSRRLIDALQYAPGNILTYCEVWGDIKEQEDKGVSTHRGVIAMIDADPLLRRFARHCATEVFYKHFKRGQHPAVDVWLEHGRKEDRSAARSAAKLAARSAAGSAAESAARSAAWSAVASASRLAARSAAWSAAWSAAELAAESAQNSWLETEAKKLMGIER